MTSPRVRAAVWVALVAVLLLAACSDDNAPANPTGVAGTPEPSPSVEASPGTTPAASPTPRPLPGVRFPADQAQTLDDLLQRAAQIRGLQPKGDVEKRLVGRQESGDYLERSLDDDDRRLLGLKQEVYRLLGLIPQQADLLQLQISLLRALVLGFYDPDVKALFVLDDLGLNSVVTRLTLVHELVHALQDQYYDLNAIDARIRENWDQSTAFTDLVEGDARGVEMEYVSPGLASSAALACDDSGFAVNSASNIPAVIQRELQAPYSDGRCFIYSIRDRLPRGVDSLYERLPESTEQVLHPLKYLEGEGPMVVELPALADRLGTGWRQTYSTTAGEFGLQNYLLLGLTDISQVKRGAAGWGGDRWALYSQDGGGRLFHLSTRWDSEAEAREFWEVLLASLSFRSGGRVSAGASQGSVRWDQTASSLRAAIEGDSVTLLVSTDAGALDRAATALGLP